MKGKGDREREGRQETEKGDLEKGRETGNMEGRQGIYKRDREYRRETVEGKGDRERGHEEQEKEFRNWRNGMRVKE